MSILVKAYQRLLADVRERSGVPIGTPDEISHKWVLIEGPMLDKQLLLCIENGGLEQPSFPDWLMPLWRAFVVSNDACYLRYIRQLLVFCYKAEYEPSDKQIQEAQASFEETDSSCDTWNLAFKQRGPSVTLRTARQIIGRVIGRIQWLDIIPCHGPGSVFPPAKPHSKSDFKTYYPSIQEYYPYDQHMWAVPSFWNDLMVHESYGKITESVDICAKLTAVPKDSRGPRLICVHPREAIWIQQGQRRLIESAIENNPITKGRINFTDQTVNGSLALSSSKDRYFATLDLKEASDRLSCDLIRYLFGTYCYNIISCARANKVRLIDGRVIELRKWAPMGNCLTFPVQSLVFWAVVHAGIRSHYGVSCNDIYVFGDDILFPSLYYDGAVRALASIGCVPNVGKTFHRGFFRESCGVDAYNGIDVTPLRMKKTDVSSAQNALAFVDLACRLRLRGYERCSSFLYSVVSQRYGKLPFCNNPNAGGLVEYVERDLGWLFLHEKRLRFRNRYHKYGVPCRLVKDATCSISNGDWYHLQDSLLSIARKGDSISDRGTEYPVPYRTRLTYGWADCYYRPERTIVTDHAKFL